jgi:hypothetical protein
MSIFNIFSSKNKKNSKSEYPKIEYGFRGEDISYRLPDKEADISFTWINNPRIYSDSINKWNNGLVMTDDEKKTVFCDVLHFVSTKRRKPIIVINSDDSSKSLWEVICSENKTNIESIEYASDEENYQFQRNMYLDILKAGKKLFFDETEIRNEQDLDKFLQEERLSDSECS